MPLFGGSSKSKSSTTTGVDPRFLPFFEQGFAEAKQRVDRGPRVFRGNRVAAFAPETEEAFQGTVDRARGNQRYLDRALGQLDETAQGREYAPQEILDLIQQGGNFASQQAQSGINQRFQGSGFGSPLHSILGTRAGAEALGRTAIPALSDLFTNQQNRQEAAIRDIPGLYNQATTAQGDILRNIGLQREAKQQERLDQVRDQFNETTIADSILADDYINRISGLGQFFRTSQGKSKNKNKGSIFSAIAPIAGTAIGGAFGGPFGAQLGGQLGGQVGGAL